MLHPMAEYSSTPKGYSSTPQVPQPWGRPTALPSMATDPPGRLMRKHGDTVCRVYYGPGGRDDQKDADYESDSAFSESGGSAISVASSEEDDLREKQNAAANVSSPSFSM